MCLRPLGCRDQVVSNGSIMPSPMLLSPCSERTVSSIVGAGSLQDPRSWSRMPLLRFPQVIIIVRVASMSLLQQATGVLVFEARGVRRLETWSEGRKPVDRYGHGSRVTPQPSPRTAAPPWPNPVLSCHLNDTGYLAAANC
jgi:hypothetical protein